MKEEKLDRLEKEKKRKWYAVFSRDGEITEEEIAKIESAVNDSVLSQPIFEVHSES